ncbi:MAG: pentapeptide repeat-containing protein, partial [Planktothrix sp.]
MTIEPNSSPSQGLEDIPETLNGTTPKLAVEPSEAETSTDVEAIPTSSADSWEIETENRTFENRPNQVSGSVVVLSAMALMILALGIDNIALGYVGALTTLAVSIRLVWSNWAKAWQTLIPPIWRNLIIACIGILGSLIGLVIFSNANTPNEVSNITINWDAIGALGDLGGALGQILIAVIAVYVAWRQYIISRDLTIQQNRITQQQTIDAYFQGVSDLALGEQGLLEDWPQERVIAEGRTSAIIKSVDAEGKAKILRFLSQARLITPLQRDRHLGRPMLDG